MTYIPLDTKRAPRSSKCDKCGQQTTDCEGPQRSCSKAPELFEAKILSVCFRCLDLHLLGYRFAVKTTRKRPAKGAKK
jgi:hypothetical protein